jgi:short-subunit dehydrogenase
MITPNKKTLAIFGAGPGLGASLATRFGKEGYQIALVARRPGPLEERVAALNAAGIEAAAFPADLTKLDGIPALVRAIEERLGGIDVAVYMPATLKVGFIPAMQLDAAKLRPLAELFTFAPIELAHALLPGLTARGGAFVYGNGLSSIVTVPLMSGVGPAMAAARNFIFTLNAEGKDKGVYAGAVTIGAFIEGSAVHATLTASGQPIHHPVIKPAEIADEVWSLVTKRDRVEAVLPQLVDGR